LLKLKKIGSEQNEWLVETLKMQQKEREMATKEVQERELARLEANIQQQKEEMLAVFSEKKKILMHQQDHPKEYVRLHQEREILSLQYEFQVAKRDLKDGLDTEVAVAEFEASTKINKISAEHFNAKISAATINGDFKQLKNSRAELKTILIEGTQLANNLENQKNEIKENRDTFTQQLKVQFPKLFAPSPPTATDWNSEESKSDEYSEEEIEPHEEKN